MYLDGSTRLGLEPTVTSTTTLYSPWDSLPMQSLGRWLSGALTPMPLGMCSLGARAVAVKSASIVCPGSGFSGGAAAPGNSLVTGNILGKLLGEAVRSTHVLPFCGPLCQPLPLVLIYNAPPLQMFPHPLVPFGRGPFVTASVYKRIHHCFGVWTSS